jgi:hypothetical protein
MSEQKLNHVDPLSFNDLVGRVHLSKDMVTIKNRDNTGPQLWLDQEEARALRNWLDKVLP